jgi:hypothetical protein
VVVDDSGERAGRGVDHVEPAVFEIVADRLDQPARARPVPAEEAGGGEFVAVRACGVLAHLFRHQLQPLHGARLERDERHAALVLRVADLGAHIEWLGVAGGGHEVGDEGLARVVGLLTDAEDGEAAAGLDGETHDAFVAADVDRVGARGLPGLASCLLTLLAGLRDADVLEEFLLLVLQELALARRFLLLRRRAFADVRELSDRAAFQSEGEEVVVAHEVDGATIA